MQSEWCANDYQAKGGIWSHADGSDSFIYFRGKQAGREK